MNGKPDFKLCRELASLASQMNSMQHYEASGMVLERLTASLGALEEETNTAIDLLVEKASQLEAHVDDLEETLSEEIQDEAVEEIVEAVNAGPVIIKTEEATVAEPATEIKPG